MRRVVTGHRNGKSVIVDDTEFPSMEIPAHNLIGGLTLTHFWETDGIPTIPLEEGDYKKQLAFKFPEPGGTRAGLAWFPPDEEIFNKARELNMDPEKVWREATGDDWGMQTTDSVDIDIILSGELWMELDDGAEVHLKPGDCVVQNGTRHAWRNRGTETCVMASFIMGAKRR